MAFLDPNVRPTNQSVLPGGINDTSSSYSPFGPTSDNTQFVTGPEGSVPDELSRNISSAGNRKITPNDDGLAAQNKPYVGTGPTLYFPLENSNPAYQARVTFKVHSLQTKMDGSTLKAFTKNVTDNIKQRSKSEDVITEEQSIAEEENNIAGSESYNVVNADAAGGGANAGAFTTKMTGAL